MIIQKNIKGIKDLCVITPNIYEDQRGYFMQTFNENFLPIHFVQDNQSKSVKNVLRGLHFQKMYPQTKLVRVIKGVVYDVAVDLRPNSPTYKFWHGIYLTETNQQQFLIPKGFAHGFLVLSDEAEFCYKCDQFYHPDDEDGILWNDPSIGIKWPIENEQDLIISQKDQGWRYLT